MRKLYIWCGHIWAFCCVGWLVPGYYLTGQGPGVHGVGVMSMLVGAACGLLAVRYWHMSKDYS